jgi:hypothetical protein
MLSKQTGASQVITATTTTQTFTLVNTNGSVVRKVRIATQDHAILVAFNTTTNLNTAGIMIPPNTSEHFTLDGLTTSTAQTEITVVRYGTNNAPASLTPVA